MIVDDLRAVSEGFRELSAGAHIIRVPFEICPLTDKPDGKWGLFWTGWTEAQRALVPSKDKKIDTSWWRPPFEKMVIVSDKSELGCLVVNHFLVEDSAIDKHYEWATSLLLIGQLQKGGPAVPLLSTFIVSHEGTLADIPSQSAWLTANTLRLLRDDVPNGFLVEIEKTLTNMWAEEPKHHELDLIHILCAFAITCGLLCCKNVKTERIVHPEKLQKARQQNGKLPLVSWHVLQVSSHIRQRDGKATGTGQPLALHWVRGHFKHYTKEKPLLGRAVGTYWWTPHLAGQADRVVLKDYEVK